METKSGLQRCLNTVRDILFNDESLKGKLFVDEANLHTEPHWDNFQNFALTNDSLIFYFDKYEIAAGAAGIPIAPIPSGTFK